MTIKMKYKMNYFYFAALQCIFFSLQLHSVNIRLFSLFDSHVLRLLFQWNILNQLKTL